MRTSILAVLAVVCAACSARPTAVRPDASARAQSQPEPQPNAEPSPQPSPMNDTPLASDVESLVRALAAELPRTPDAAALAALEPRILRVPGVRSSTLSRGASWTPVIEVEPFDADRFARALSLRNAYVVSPDVHQHGWIIVLWTAEVPDEHGRRIATAPPRFGEWELVARVDRRPPGPLPGIAAGASPAYPLERARVKVTSLEIRRVRR